MFSLAQRMYRRGADDWVVVGLRTGLRRAERRVKRQTRLPSLRRLLPMDAYDSEATEVDECDTEGEAEDPHRASNTSGTTKLGGALVTTHAETDRMVSQLCEMGYSVQAARRALAATRLVSVNAAVEYLLEKQVTNKKLAGNKRSREQQEIVEKNGGNSIGKESVRKYGKLEHSHYVESQIRLTRVPDLSAPENIGCVGLTDILSESPIESLLVFNYMVDLDFLMSCLPVEARTTVPITIVHGERGQARDVLRAKVMESYSNVTLVTPNLPISYGTHHTKAFVICFKNETMRVVIHTANIILRDWSNKTQAVYLTPMVPKKSTGMLRSEFEQDLLGYMEAYRDSRMKPFCDKIKEHDFSECKAVLVGSVPGRFTGANCTKWGHLRLRSVLSRVNLDETVFGKDSAKKSTIVAQFSSVGSLGTDDTWLLNEFGQSLRSARNSLKCSNSDFRIVYPTAEDVRWSLDGWASGGALPFSNANYEKQKSYMYPQMCRWVATKSGREHVMPHIKTYARFVETDSETRIGWFLLTSANLSKAAWGSFEKNETQFMVRSYELGVLVHPDLWKTPHRPVVHMVNMTKTPPYTLPQLTGSKVESWFENGDESDKAPWIVPIRLPYDVPLTPYDAAEGDEGWTWDLVRTQEDRHGQLWPRTKE